MNIKSNKNKNKKTNNHTINNQTKLNIRPSTTTVSRYCFNTKEIPIIPTPFSNREIKTDYKNSTILKCLKQFTIGHLVIINCLLKSENEIKYKNNDGIAELILKTCYGTGRIDHLGLTRQFAAILKQMPLSCKNLTFDQSSNVKVCYKTLVWIIVRKIGFEKEKKGFENHEFENNSDILIQNINPIIDEAIIQFEQIKEKHFAIFQILVNPDFGCIAKYLKTREYFGGNARIDLNFIAPRLVTLSESVIGNMAAEFCMLQNLIDCCATLKQLPKTFNNTLAVYNVLQKYYGNLTSIKSSAQNEYESLKKDYPENPLHYYANLTEIVSKVQSLQDNFLELLTKVPSIVEEDSSSNSDTLTMPLFNCTEPQDASPQIQSDPIDTVKEIENISDQKPEKVVSSEIILEDNLPLEAKEEEKTQLTPQLPTLLTPEPEISNEDNLDEIEQELISYKELLYKLIENDKIEKLRLQQEKINRKFAQTKVENIEEQKPVITENKPKVRKLNPDQKELLLTTFSDKPPHLMIHIDEIRHLATACGLTVKDTEGSKHNIHVKGSKKILGEFEHHHGGDKRYYIKSNQLVDVGKAFRFAIERKLIIIDGF